MREIRLDGLIPDSELQRRGWGLDAKLQFADPCEERTVFTVVALDPALKKVTLQYKASPNDDADEDGESFVVDRAYLSYMYKTYKLAALQVCFLFIFKYFQLPPPQLQTSAYIAHTLAPTRERAYYMRMRGGLEFSSFSTCAKPPSINI